MSMLIALFLMLLLVAVIVHIIRRTPVIYNDYDDDEVVTTTTTTTTTTVTEDPGYTVVGNLTRRAEGAQFYVIDPVDGEKTWVNGSDDMYQDAGSKVWKMV